MVRLNSRGPQHTCGNGLGCRVYPLVYAYINIHKADNVAYAVMHVGNQCHCISKCREDPTLFFSLARLGKLGKGGEKCRYIMHDRYRTKYHLLSSPSTTPLESKASIRYSRSFVTLVFGLSS